MDGQLKSRALSNNDLLVLCLQSTFIKPKFCLRRKKVLDANKNSYLITFN